MKIIIYKNHLFVRAKNRLIWLTDTEMKVLREILRNRYHVSTRKEIKKAVWPRQKIGDQTIEQFVARIRKKIGGRLIKTVHSHGYVIPESVQIKNVLRL